MSNVKLAIIGAQLDNVNDELHRKEKLLKSIDTASGRQRVSYSRIKQLALEVEELKERKVALENQVTEFAIMGETYTNVPEAKLAKLGKKRFI